MAEKLSALVISYNRAAVIGTCLRALSFADEVIVVDKSSTDATPEIATRHADRVITVPWTPTVEDTRAFAVDQCSGDWILCLDDDECLSPESGAAIRAELAAPRADIYYLPQRHYILGVHDESAYYWPEYQPRLFRRGAVGFIATVHGGTRPYSDRTMRLSPKSGVAIHHLSHRDVAEWIDKCNRYTSRPDRERPPHDGNGIAAFARGQLEHWQSRSRGVQPGGYSEAVAVLRAVYDIVDRLKTWEEERGLDGAAAFAQRCCELDAAYAALPSMAPRAGEASQATPPPPASQDDAARAALIARVAELRTRCDAAAADAALLRAELGATVDRYQEAQHALAAEHVRSEAFGRDAEAARRDAEAAEQRARAAERQAEAAEQQAQATARQADAIRAQLAAIETSTCWRATAGMRRIGERIKRLTRNRSAHAVDAALCEWSE